VTILGRFIRDLLDRILGRFHEGPEPPPRLAEEVRLFRVLASSRPTEEEWEAFAVRLTERAYRDGFVRGVHWLERSWPGPEIDPDRLLEEQAHGVKLADDPAWAHVLDQPMRAREVREFHDSVANAALAGVDVHVMPGRRER